MHFYKFISGRDVTNMVDLCIMNINGLKKLAYLCVVFLLHINWAQSSSEALGSDARGLGSNHGLCLK